MKTKTNFRLFRNREYKEALRQQRNQDSHAIYRPKEAKEDTSPNSTQSTPSPSNHSTTIKSITSTPTTTHIQNSSSSTNSTSSPLSPRFAHNSSMKYVGPSPQPNANGSNGSTESVSSNGATPITLKSPLRSDKPIQKVTPSRNSTPIKYQQQVTSPTNGNVSITTKPSSTYNAYIKPNNPAKPTSISSNGSPLTNNIPKSNGTPKSTQKTPRLVNNYIQRPQETDVNQLIIVCIPIEV